MKQHKEDRLISEAYLKRLKEANSNLGNAATRHFDKNNFIGLPNPDSFEIEGYKYEPETDDQGDVKKIYHYVIAPGGSRLEVDWSPYKHMTPDDLKLWIKLGMPKRVGTGPLSSETLHNIANQKNMYGDKKELPGSYWNPKSRY
jgi:hypothetical protein